MHLRRRLRSPALPERSSARGRCAPASCSSGSGSGQRATRILISTDAAARQRGWQGRDQHAKCLPFPHLSCTLPALPSPAISLLLAFTSSATFLPAPLRAS